jgi:hypothetical protein
MVEILQNNYEATQGIPHGGHNLKEIEVSNFFWQKQRQVAFPPGLSTVGHASD